MHRSFLLILVTLAASSFAEDQPCVIRVHHVARIVNSVPLEYIQVIYPAGVMPPAELSQYQLGQLHKKDGRTVVFLKLGYEFAEPSDKLADLANYKLSDLQDTDHHCMIGGILAARPVTIPTQP